MEMTYSWKYSEKTEPRGRILFKAIKPLLEEGDKFLDMNCGYSPMATHIIEHGHTITGFDIAPEPIHHLRRTCPQGHWPATPDAGAHFQGYTVLLLLGVTTALKKIYSQTYLESAERLLWLNIPRVILIETADGADQKLYLQLCELLEGTGRYMRKLEGRYDAEMRWATNRHYSIWVREWDYPFWQELFRNAKDDELDALHERYYKVAGRKINPLVVYDPDTREIIPPKITVKDEFVKKLILQKEGLKTMLNVAFWEGRFAFNMGFEGFKVTGVECYRKAVDMANRSLVTLPPKIAARFKFNYGFAERLKNYPKYDVVVNHCLEHVRDPGHVVRETLKHVKPGGYAYFTPPLRHGADSPTHLHHWMTEEELLELVPEGYTANIHKTKLQTTDHKLNIFIMEVTAS